MKSNQSIILDVDILPLITELYLIYDFFLLFFHHGSMSLLRLLGLLFFYLFIFSEIGNRHNDFLHEVKEPEKVIIRVDTTNIPTAFKQFFQLQLHELAEVKLLQVVNDANTVNSS